MKFILPLLIALFSITLYGQDQVVWRQYMGPYSGNITSFTSIGDTIFAGADLSGVFYSTDKGYTWECLGMKGNIQAMTTIDTVLLAGVNSYLYYSRDQGLAWDRIDMGQHNVNMFFKYDNKTFAGTNLGVMLVDDKDFSLEDRSNGMEGEYHVVWDMLSIDTIMFCGVAYDGMYRSSDEGLNWTRVSLPSFMVGVHNIINYHDTLIITDDCNGRVYFSTDTTKSWNLINNGLAENIYYTDLIIFRDTLYMSTNGGVYNYDRHNLSWGLVSDYSFYSMYIKDDVLFGTNGDGVYRRDDIKKDFILSNKGINSSRVYDMALFDNELFTATSSGTYSTPDDGETWKAVPGTLNTYCYSLMVRDSLIFVGTANGIYSREDDSEVWSETDNGLTSKVVWDLKQDDTTVYAATDDGVFRLKDKENIWAGTAPKIQFLELSIGMGNVFAQANEGIYKLNKVSGEFELAAFGGEDIEFLQIAGEYIYVSTFPNYLYRSADTCKTWSLVNITGVFKDIFKRGDNLYLTRGNRIAYSSDNGENWDDWMETGIPDYYILRVIQADTCLYAATYGHSVFKRSYQHKTDATSDTYAISSDNTITNVQANTTLENFTNNIVVSYGASTDVNGGKKMSLKAGSQVIKDGDVLKVIAEDQVNIKSYMVKIPQTHVIDQEANSLYIYPNPANDKLFISDLSDIKSWSILDGDGRVIKICGIISDNIEISSLADGIYYLRFIKKDNSAVVLRFVKV